MYKLKSEGYDYIYSCTNCNHNERVSREDVTINHSCYRCQNKSEVIGLITDEGLSKFIMNMTEEEKTIFLNEHNNLLTLLKQINRASNGLSERLRQEARARQIDSEAQALGERTAHIQADIDSLSATNNKSNELFNILLETKPEAEKTLEVLGDTIINNNKRIVRRMKELEKIQAEAIDLLLEKNSISLKLKREKD